MSGAEEPLRARIKKNYEYLINELRVSLYVNVLLQENVLSMDDKERLSGICDRREKARTSVGILMLKDETRIEKFFRFQTGKQRHIYERLFQDIVSNEQEQRVQQRDGSNESASRFKAAARSASDAQCMGGDSHAPPSCPARCTSTIPTTRSPSSGTGSHTNRVQSTATISC